MKKDELLKKKKELLEEIKQLDFASSKIVMDEGFLPFNMKANKRKLMDKLEKIEEQLAKPPRKPAPKKVTPKKEEE